MSLVDSRACEAAHTWEHENALGMTMQPKRQLSTRMTLLALTLLLAGLGSGRAAAQVECLVLGDEYAARVAADLAANTSGIQYSSWDYHVEGNPTVGDLGPFDVVLFYGYAGCPADSVGLGDVIYDWYDDGGVGLVLGTRYWRIVENCGGAGMLETIDALDPAGSPPVGESLDPTSVLPHPVTEDLFTLDSFREWHGAAQLAAGAANLASWADLNPDGTIGPVVGIRSEFGSRVVGVSMGPFYGLEDRGDDYDGDFHPLWENAILWSADQSCPPWEIPMGAADSSSDSSDEVKLDILEVAEDVILEDFEFYADVVGMESATFVVYEGIAAAWNYDRIWSEDLTISGSGWHSSGEINIPLTAGRFYAIGIEVSQDITYYWTNAQPTVDEWWGVHESAESVDDPDSVISVTPSTGVAYVMQANLAAICDVDGDGHDRPYDCDDADAAVDDAGLDLWYADTDGDGFGDPAVSIYSCSQPAGFVADDTDCDDANPQAHPAALEMCDGFDNDCDGDVDEDDAVDAVIWFEDADGDGYGDLNVPYMACTSPPGFVATPNDCDDGDPDQHPGADEYCNGEDDDCDGLVDEDDAVDPATWYEDADGDGYGNSASTDVACAQPPGFVADDTDCDDSDPAQHPGADEYCNGEDDDCDGTVDEDDAVDADTWYIDFDGDGFGHAFVSQTTCDQPPGFVSNNDDCDDADRDQNPDADEYCNSEDDDCDGDVDEDDAVDATTWYEDGDGDGYGNAASTHVACAQPLGFVADDTDCDDADAAQYPGADEYCNGEDDDCDGTVDEDDAVDALGWHEDADGDGYGNPFVVQLECTQPPGYVSDDTDCDDADAAQYPGAGEYCNNEDDDCDGTVDEDDAVDAGTWYQDLDGDGQGNMNATLVQCDSPAGYVSNGEDCDDTDAAIYLGADEYCNAADDDCDGTVDEDDAVDASTWYEDADGDSYGNSASTHVACAQPLGFVSDDTDCDDADATQYPGADEYCNNEDDDCDGDVDEDDAVDAVIGYEDADGDGFGDAAVTEVACDLPPGFVADSTDCDDSDAAVNPSAEEVCNGVDDDCDPGTHELGDHDGDGYTLCDGDCDDEDLAVNPSAEEICDGVDNDCDPTTDEESDADGDGYTLCDDDCDDDEAAVFPGNPEVCDRLDNDCDGVLPGDEVDDDGDFVTECEGDCDDGDHETYYGAPEQCDGIDNDCDGAVDEDVDLDLDGDGFNACQGDCDNYDTFVYSGAPEICDGKDSDCDGVLPLDEYDADGDGWIPCEGDCDDTDADLNLDDLDGDLWTTCDGDCDDGDVDLNLDDLDGDLWTTCDGDCDDFDVDLNLDDLDGDLWTTCDGDCDDTIADVSPDAIEVCDDLVDNDCDGDIDAEDDECDEPGDDDDTVGDDDDDDTIGDDDDTSGDDDDTVGDDDDTSGDDDDTVGDDDIAGDDDTAGAEVDAGCECAAGGSPTGGAVPVMLAMLGSLVFVRRRHG